MSFTVLDPATGEEVEITARNLGEVQQRLAAGALTLRPDQEISVAGPEGEIVTLSASDPAHQDYLRRVVAGAAPGLRLATRAEVEDVTLAEQYQDRPFEAGMIGVLQGASAGFAPALMSEAGQEYARRLREQNPGAVIAGEIAGTVGVGALTGGLAAEVRAGTTAAQTARAALATETLAPRVAARGAAEGFLARVGQRTTSLALEGAAEGAVFGAGQTVSEAALQNTDLTAESLLAGTLTGALWGGVAGGSLGAPFALGETAFEGAARWIGSRGVVSREAREAARDLYRAGTGVDLPDSVADDLVRASDPEAVWKGRAGDLVGATARKLGLGDDAAETARRLATDSAFARMATEAEEVLGEVRPRLRERFDRLTELSDLTDDIIHARAKRSMFEQGVTQPLSIEGRQAGAQLLDDVLALAQGLDEHRGVYGLGGTRLSKELRAIVDDLGAPVRMPRAVAEAATEPGPFDDVLRGVEARPTRQLRSFREAFGDATPDEATAIATGRAPTRGGTDGGRPFAPIILDDDRLFPGDPDLGLPPGGPGSVSLRDGNHRLAAAREAGATRISAEVHQAMPDGSVQVHTVEIPISGLDDAARAADDVAASLTVQGAVDQATALDAIKRRLGRLQRTRDPNIKAEIRDLYEKFRLHLEDESFYGGGATAQREMNEALSRWIANDDVFSKTFLTKSGRRSAARPWEDSQVFDPTKASRWYDTAGTGDGRIIDDVIDQQIAGLEDVFARMRAHYDLPDDVAAKIDRELPDVVRGLREDVGRVRDTVGARNAFASLQSAAGPRLIDKLVGGTGVIGSSILGGVAGGPVGALAGAAVRLPSAIRQAIPEAAAAIGKAGGGRPLSPALLRARTATVVATQKIRGAARGFVRGVTREQRKAVSTASFTARLLRTRAVVEVFRDHAQSIVDADEQAIADRSASLAMGFEGDAPTTAQAVAAKTAAAVAYLRSTLPGAALPDPEVPGDTVGEAASHEMSAWLRRAQAVEAPIEAAERAARGDASPEEIEALDAVYPELAGLLRETVTEELIEARRGGETVTWQRRQLLHSTLGVRADRAVGVPLTLSTGLGVQTQPLAQPPGGEGQQPAFTPPGRPLRGDAQRDEAPSKGYNPNEE